MTPDWIIAKKRDGDTLSDQEIRWVVAEYAAGRLPDYQMAALAMAIYLRGMSTTETVSLTESMLASGTRLAWPDLPGPAVDKHSTGGIGDKISIILAPLLASCGLFVPMISGRGLGATGGTLDKLESIPGFRTDLSIQELQSVVRRVGCVITGATNEIAPADRELYALRDVTATVASIPLITASILSKKLAEGIDYLVLDVKYGSGADACELRASIGGFVTRIETELLGRAVIEMGGGRKHKGDEIDHSVGLQMHVRVGDWVEQEKPYVTVYAHRPRIERVKQLIQSAIVIDPQPPAEIAPLIREWIHA